MAYIPPHKRHSKDSDGPSLAPALFVPPTSQNPRRNSKPTNNPGWKVRYANESISKWFVVPSNDDDDQDQDPQLLPCSIRLQEFSCESTQRQERQPMILVCDVRLRKDVNENANSIVKSPWVFITEKIQQDLLSSFQNARREMCNDGPELNVPRFVIRFGKILFHGGTSISLDNINKTSTVETILRKLKGRFYTSVPNSFLEAILGEFIRKIGLDFRKEKERYYVKVLDKARPDATITCKCNLIEAIGELDIDKIELNEVRQLVVDISCLDRNLDLRLLLSSKRSLSSVNDDEKHSLSTLIKSAVIDSEVKGGLRWPLGKESLGDRYTVVGVGHTKGKIFESPFMRLRFKHADRFDFRTSTGEDSLEANLKIPELTRQLRHPFGDALKTNIKQSSSATHGRRKKLTSKVFIVAKAQQRLIDNLEDAFAKDPILS